MLSIGTRSVGSLRQTQLVQHAFDRVFETSVKLATLKRINRGSDDPAGLIAATELHRELNALEEAAAATERTRALVRVADSGLGQAANLLNEIEGQVVAAANVAISPDEQAAIQIEIDAALDALDRIGVSTKFAGKRVFTGESSTVLTGPNPGDRAPLEIRELSGGALGGESGTLADVRAGGSASVSSGNAESAGIIIEQARQQILLERTELGAFERATIDARQRLLADTSVSLSSSLSRTVDADFALESANLVKAMTLADSAVAVARLTSATHRTSTSLLSGLLDVVS